MTIREQIKRVAQLLEGRIMFFDWDSYDDEMDIPHLILDGERQNIDNVYILKDGSVIEVTTEKFVYGFTLTEDEENTFESIEKRLEEIGMEDFLRDVYYEHPRSWEIGDYEDDFLTWDGVAH